jgi:hypothetical protein
MIGLVTAVPAKAARPFAARMARQSGPRLDEAHGHFQAPRYEFKYRLDETTAAGVRDFARAFVQLDPHADRTTFSYPINSLYLDSDDLLTFWNTVQSVPRNYKLRVRTYSDHPDAPVFFEIKRGIGDTVLKERGAVRSSAVPRILAGSLPEAADMASPDPTHRAAVENFVRLMLQIDAKPKAWVRYIREAWVGRDDPEVRFTMDRDVGVTPKSTSALANTNLTAPAMPFGRKVVLEMKFNGRMPLWFRDLASVVGLKRGPAAKYCEGLQLHELDQFSAVKWPAANQAAVPATDRSPAPRVSRLPFDPRFERPAMPTVLAAARS